MTKVLEGLRANYSGKVLARAIRAVKEQGRENEEWVDIDRSLLWINTKEGWVYWDAIYKRTPNPDQYLPEGYVDVDETIDGVGVEVCEKLSPGLIRKIQIHVETTEECLDNFSLPEYVKDLLIQDMEIFREVLKEVSND